MLILNSKELLEVCILKKPFSQDKLIRVIRGSIQDVVVDIRLNSKSFGKYKTFILNEKNKNQLFVPSGFAHGYCSLEDDTIVHYKVSKYYNPNSEITIKWNDEDLKNKVENSWFNSSYFN